MPFSCSSSAVCRTAVEVSRIRSDTTKSYPLQWLARRNIEAGFGVTLRRKRLRYGSVGLRCWILMSLLQYPTCRV